MAQVSCPRCSANWPSDFQFCGKCGGPLRDAAPVAGPVFVPIPPPPSGAAPIITGLQPLPSGAAGPGGVVRLVVLRGAVTEGTGYEIREGRVTLGRTGDLAFAADPLVADQHLVLENRSGLLSIVGINSPAGVFRRIREPTTVDSGDVIFAGEQYLLARTGEDVPYEAVASADLPPETFGTPLPAPHLHLTQLLAGGLPGRVVSTDREFLTIGREGCDLSFPQDRFMSGRHLRVEVQGPRSLQIVDVGSLNGTFVRIAATPHRLAKGDELLVGSMLFRVDVRDS